MTNNYVMPPEQPQRSKNDIVTLAAIAGVVITALLLVVVGLLRSAGIGVGPWIAFGVGVYFGFAGAIATTLVLVGSRT